MTSNTITKSNKHKQKPKIIFVGGSDNIGGAGILADVKTAEYFNCYSMVVFTCITAQNFNSIHSIKLLSTKLVISQLNSLIITNLLIKYIKISLLFGVKMIKSISIFLNSHPKICLIYDTVFVKNNNEFFVSDSDINLLIKKIIPCTYLTTSNVEEFKYLLKKAKIDYTETNVYSLIDIKAFISNLCNKFLKVKRYFLRGIKIIKAKKIVFANVLFYKNSFYVYQFKHIRNANDHGSGCAISAAIICNLANGFLLPEACKRATVYATRCIQLANNKSKTDFSINFSHK